MERGMGSVGKRLCLVVLTFCMLGTVAIAKTEESVYLNDISVKVLKKSTKTDSGDTLKYPISGAAEVTMLKVTVPVNSVTGWHYHPVPGYAILVSGFLEIEFDTGEKNIYKPGDIIYEAINQVHQGRNIGDEPVELIAIFTGIKDQPITIKPDSLR